MEMNEQNWTRKEYETWDEAFRGLAPAVRQQSVRIAAYTQALFVQACAGSFGTNTRDGAERMQGQYADLEIVEGASYGDEIFAVGLRQGSDLKAELDAFLKTKYADGTMAALAEKYSVGLNTEALK